jgi:electron transfer flavoprotein alpha subunit
MAEKIWAVVQLRNGDLHPLSIEVVAAAQQLAGDGDVVEAVVAGHDLAAAQEKLTHFDLNAVRTMSSDALRTYTPGALIGALGWAIRDQTPDLVLFPHTYQSVDFVPRLARDLDAVLVPEVTGTREEAGGRLWLRPVFAGKLQAAVRVSRPGLVMATLQAGAFAAENARPGSAPVTPIDLGIEPIPDREVLGIEEVAGEHVDLSQADIIVAVGRGIGEAEKIAIVEELATALGGELGASRPVIDSEWLDRDRQIGSSGQTVSPKLYVAIGISGAIQHLVGMKGSQIVVAINKDASAPIFGVADYGIVGDLFEIVPVLTEVIKEARSA